MGKLCSGLNFVLNEFLILFGRNIFPLIESTCGLRDGFLRALDDHPIVESSFKPQVRSGKSPDELYCLSHQIQIQIQKTHSRNYNCPLSPLS